ncbi:MAG: GNAT family N-acetyltransferase [Vicingaceae bacterium]
MEIKKQQFEERGKLIASQTSQKMGEMSYSVAADKWIIDHTEVSGNFRGEGVGEKLLEALVKEAREKQVEILPLCPFAASVFQKRVELQDVLKKK